MRSLLLLSLFLPLGLSAQIMVVKLNGDSLMGAKLLKHNKDVQLDGRTIAHSDILWMRTKTKSYTIDRKSMHRKPLKKKFVPNGPEAMGSLYAFSYYRTKTPIAELPLVDPSWAVDPGFVAAFEKTTKRIKKGNTIRVIVFACIIAGTMIQAGLYEPEVPHRP